MVGYKIDYTPLIAKGVAEILGVPFTENGYVVENDKMHAQVKAFQLNEHLSVMISRFLQFEPLTVVRQGTTNDDLLVLDFHVSESASLNLESLSGPRTLMHGAYFASSDVESSASFVKRLENKQVTIVLSRTWVKSFFSDAGNELSQLLEKVKSFFFFQPIDLELSKDIYHCYDYALSSSKFENAYLLGHVIKILSRFFDAFLETDRNTASYGIDAHNMTQMTRVKNYIEVEKEKKISIHNLLELTAMSESKFRKMFKSVFGLSPYEYIKLTKIWHAKHLIESGQPVSQAAYAIGYINLSYFAKSFKQTFGVLPSNYKSNLNT